MANQNITLLPAQTGSAAPTSLFYAVTTGNTDTGLPLSVLVNNLGLTGISTAPTAANGTSSTQIASTAFVQNALTSGSLNWSTGGTVTITNITNSTSTTTGSLVTSGGVGVAGNIYCGGTYNGAAVITSGSVNSAPIGAVTPNTGAFTTLSSSGLASLNSMSTGTATITGGTINGTSVGLTTPSTGNFTTLSASSTVSGTGFSTYLASPPAIGGTAANTGKFTTVVATSTITPSTTSGIVGTTLADNANAGSIGEYQTNTTSGTSLSNATPANATSITLTAGDWDVQGGIQYIPAATTTVQTVTGSINTTSATLGSLANGLFQVVGGSATFLSTGVAAFVQTGTVRVNVSTSTTVYLVAQATFGTSTMTCNGQIRARRVR